MAVNSINAARVATQSMSSSSSSLRSQVLSLYRTILRLSRTWQAKQSSETGQERQYIVNEARRSFRLNRDLTSESAIQKALVEGRARVEVARHYRIPYPRPVYYGTGTLTRLNKRRIKEE